MRILLTAALLLLGLMAGSFTVPPQTSRPDSGSDQDQDDAAQQPQEEGEADDHDRAPEAQEHRAESRAQSPAVIPVVPPRLADPASILHGPTERGDLCSEHRLLYRRIDIIEEQVEKTVEYLYSEIDSLLDSISGASWALPSAPGAPLLDIFDDDSR